MKDIVIADLDGTIALIDHRRHWLDAAKHPEMSNDERWRRFFADCFDDLPNRPVIETLEALSAMGNEIRIFSGRSDEVRASTEEWLSAHLFFPWSLKMRPAGDFTPDEELKAGWLADMLEHERILCVFDDRDKVVQMWRSKGLSCFQVAPGNF